MTAGPCYTAGQDHGQEAPHARSTPLRRSASATAAMPAALHRLLDTLETAVVEGDQEQVAALSEQLWPWA